MSNNLKTASTAILLKKLQLNTNKIKKLLRERAQLMDDRQKRDQLDKIRKKISEI